MIAHNRELYENDLKVNKFQEKITEAGKKTGMDLQVVVSGGKYHIVKNAEKIDSSRKLRDEGSLSIDIKQNQGKTKKNSPTKSQDRKKVSRIKKIEILLKDKNKKLENNQKNEIKFKKSSTIMNLVQQEINKTTNLKTMLKKLDENSLKKNYSEAQIKNLSKILYSDKEKSNEKNTNSNLKKNPEIWKIQVNGIPVAEKKMTSRKKILDEENIYDVDEILRKFNERKYKKNHGGSKRKLSDYESQEKYRNARSKEYSMSHSEILK